MLNSDTANARIFPISKGEHYDDIIENIGIKEAHKKYKGQGVKVLFIDTGIQSDHKDIDNKNLIVKDFVYKESGIGADRTGHGTHVAGVVIAKGGRQAIVGIAPKITAYVAKVIEERKEGSQSRLREAIDWGIEEEVQLINLSFGTDYPLENDTYEKIKEAYNKGIILVGAAGNDNYNVNYPAKYPEVIAVSSIQKNSIKSDFSNFGKEIEVMAPGEDILGLFPYNKYARMTGTSMATPIVTGCLALYMEKYYRDNKKWPTPAIVREALANSVKDIGKIGRDPYYGYGKINVTTLLGLS